MVTAKEKIEQTLMHIGINPADAWQQENAWYLLENNGKMVVIREKEISFSDSDENAKVINILAPILTLTENMPIDFYKEIMNINNTIGDGTALHIEGEKSLISSIFIANEFYTPAFGIYGINNVYAWANTLTAKLELKYKDYLFS